MTFIVFIVSLLGGIAIGMPIAFALLLSGVVLMFSIDFFDPQIIAQSLVSGADSFPLLAIPFFMLAGELMNRGGLSRRLVDLAMACVGHRRGGMGYVVILAAVFIAALSGSAVADAAALSALLMPMMIRAGHSPERATGLAAISSTIAPILPPSIPMVLLGVVGNVSISKLFMAGIVPGLILAVAFATTWTFLSRGEDVAPLPKRSGADVWAAARAGLWAMFLPIIILFGLRFGVFTPTEAGVIAAAYALFVSLVVYREMSFKDLFGAFVSAAVTTSVVMLLVAAAMVSAWVITVSEVSQGVLDLLMPLSDNPTLLLFAIMATVIVVGFAMDMTPIILVLVPLVMPAVMLAGVDPVYFGVLFVMSCCLGLVTPPVGVVLNVVAGITKVRIESVIKGVSPYFFVYLAVLSAFIIWPALVTVPASWFS